MKQALRFTLTLFAAVPVAAYASHPLVVKTDKGQVRGAFTMEGQVRAFKGIPFAAPPVGDLRWQPPQPAASWNGVRDATQFGDHCLQLVNAFHTFRDPGASEDCLTLNVWTSANAKKGSLPVMVWLYGGGFRAGGSSEPRQDGEVLAAQHNIVIVSMNYRVGLFGFFAHPELTAESPHHASGNYGLMDQSAALDWVQRNIANFGGDPHNVTIFGQSAGSLSVSLLMASPLAKGQFAKAIGESGGAFFGPLQDKLREVQEQEDVKFSQAAFGTSRLADLRKIPGKELLKKALAHNRQAHIWFGPDVDGWFLPEPISQIYAEGKQAHVPLLAGWNADEQRGSVILAHLQPTAKSFRLKANAEFGSDAAEFLKLYPANTDAEAVRSAGDLAGDRFIEYSTWRWLEWQVRTGDVPAYRYHFDLGSPGDKQHPAVLGAFHSDDIEYVFGTLDTRPGAKWRPEDRKLSKEIGEYWTNFARTGNPNGDDLPHWPTYNAADNWQVMQLNAISEAKPDTRRARYLFLDKEWGKPAAQEAEH